MYPRRSDRPRRIDLVALVFCPIIAMAGCSADSPPQTAKPAATIAPEEPASGKKGAKLKPGQQVPGSANYEDKPGRGRGR